MTSVDRIASIIRSLHPHGDIRPDALVIDGDVVGLHDRGCQTCLTSWPCPTVSALNDVTTGVNGGPGISLPRRR